METSIIIAVANDKKIKKCIESIDENVETIVVLNGATKEVKEIVKNLGVKYTEIPERNIGQANNIGIEIATNEKIIFMDSDCVFEKGTIKKLSDGLKNYKIAKGMVIFKHNDFETKLVAEARKVSTTELVTAFKPCLAIRKSLINDIGYYFDNDIHFREDYDLTCRVFAKKVPINFIPEAIVYHDPLPIFYDLRSTFRYGCGHRIGIVKGILKGNMLWGGHRKIFKSLQLDLRRIIHAPKYLLRVIKTKGFLVALYLIIWMFIFSLGYYCETIFKLYSYKTKSQ